MKKIYAMINNDNTYTSLSHFCPTGCQVWDIMFAR